jgi:hypothetical protein
MVALVLEANCLDEDKLEKARNVFLLGPQTGVGGISGPSYRTGDYAIWRACQRLGIRPPGVKESAGTTAESSPRR